MNILNSYTNSCYSHEVQVTPTKDKIFKKNYNEYREYVKDLVERYVKSRTELIGNSLIASVHNHFETREISRLKEAMAKTRVLPYYDELLVRSTPLSQNINYMLGKKDTIENYSYVNRLINELNREGIYIINLSNYAIVLNPQDDFYKQREVVMTLVNKIRELDDKGLLPQTISDEDYNKFIKDPLTVLLSVENLGYEITEEEYAHMPSIRNRINNDPMVLTILNLGFNIKFLFKEKKVKVEVGNNKSFIHDKKDNGLDSIL